MSFLLYRNHPETQLSDKPSLVPADTVKDKNWSIKKRKKKGLCSIIGSMNVTAVSQNSAISVLVNNLRTENFQQPGSAHSAAADAQQ